MKHKLIHPKTNEVVNVGQAGIALWQRKGYVLQVETETAPVEVEQEKKTANDAEKDEPLNEVEAVETETVAPVAEKPKGRPAKVKVIED